MRHFNGMRLSVPANLSGPILATLLVVAAPAGAAIKELSNDSFSGTGPVMCVVGFVEGESGAVKLTAEPSDYPYRIVKVRTMVCPDSPTVNVILRIFEDNTGTVLPGPMLFEEMFQVTGSDNAFNEFNLSFYDIVVASGSVRVEVEWQQASPPGLGRDSDGIVSNVNYIYTGGWVYAELLGLTGDWIVRLEVETGVDDPIFADGFESGSTTKWSSVAGAVNARDAQ